MEHNQSNNTMEPQYPYNYQAFGLPIASALACPELSTSRQPAEVTIEYGEVPTTLPVPSEKGVRFEVAPGQFLLHVDDVARYLVVDGRKILIQPMPGADLDSIRLFLLGSAFGALLHQREILPLHASTIVIEGGCAAFMGHSGIGKSTLAAGFRKQGFEILGDDICAITLSADGTPMAHPGFPQIKLWANVLKMLQEDSRDLRRVRPQIDKHALPLQKEFACNPLPLRKLYVLTTHNKDDFRLHPITGPAKFSVLRNNTYRYHFLKGQNGFKSHFTLCSKIAQKTPISRVIRPSNAFRLAELLALLGDDLKG